MRLVIDLKEMPPQWRVPEGLLGYVRRHDDGSVYLDQYVRWSEPGTFGVPPDCLGLLVWNVRSGVLEIRPPETEQPQGETPGADKA